MKVAFKVLIDRQDVLGYIIDVTSPNTSMPILGHVGLSDEYPELYSVWLFKDDIDLLVKTWREVGYIIKILET